MGSGDGRLRGPDPPARRDTAAKGSTMTRVAAVIVTSNSERWLEQTLASVVAQTRQPDEIVIVANWDSSSQRKGVVLGGGGVWFALRCVPGVFEMRKDTYCISMFEGFMNGHSPMIFRFFFLILYL